MRKLQNKINANHSPNNSYYGIVVVMVSVLFLSIFFSCNKDEASVPSYRTDIISILTNKDTMATHLLLDNGKRYNIVSQNIKTTVPNGNIRCYASFSINEDSTDVKIYEIKRISCYTPLPADSFKIHPHDPLNVTSVWKSGGYVNMCLAPKAIGFSAFKYDFSIDSVTISSVSSATIIHTSLLFQFTGAINSYTTKFYHSMPLQQSLYPVPFDSLYFYVNTYDGVKVWKYSK